MSKDELLGCGLGMVLPSLVLLLRLSKPAAHSLSLSLASRQTVELEAQKGKITGWNKKNCTGNSNEIKKQAVRGTILITKVYKGERVIHMQNGLHRAWPNPTTATLPWPPKHSLCHSHWAEETCCPGETPLSLPWQCCEVL